MRALDSGVDRAYEPLPPHNTDAEEAVLGSIMADPMAGIAVGDFLKASDFYGTRNRAVYSAMLRVAGRAEAPDFIAVCDELERTDGDVDAAYVARLLSAVPSPFLAEQYGRIVQRTAIYRQLISAAGRIAALAYEDSPDVDDILHRAQAVLCAVTRGRAPRIRTF